MSVPKAGGRFPEGRFRKNPFKINYFLRFGVCRASISHFLIGSKRNRPAGNRKRFGAAEPSGRRETESIRCAFAILIRAFTRPQYTQFQQCSSTAEASKVIEILDSNSIEYKTSTDGLRIQVKNSQLSAANLALGAAGYIPDDYTLDEALSGGFSSTQSDTQKRYANYLEKQAYRSEERRVGKECRSRWSPYH